MRGEHAIHRKVSECSFGQIEYRLPKSTIGDTERSMIADPCGLESKKKARNHE